MLRVRLAVVAIAATIGEELHDEVFVNDYSEGEVLELWYGKVSRGGGRDVHVAAAVAGGEGWLEDEVEGGPEGGDFALPVMRCVEGGGDGFEGD